MASGVRVSQARTQEKERWERQATERARASTPDAHGGRGSRPNSATKRPGSATKRPATADDASSSSSKQSMVPRINHGEGRQEGDGRDQLCVSATPRAQLKIVHDHPDDPRTKKNTKANMLSRKESSWKRDLQVFLDDPNSTNAAMGFAVAMVILILVSAFILVFHESDCKGAIFGHWLGYFEVIACVIFSLEIVARFAVSQNVQGHPGPYLIFDILAVLPCWLMPLRSCGQFLKMLKTLRMFRLLKLARRYEGSVVIVRAMKLSMPALTVAFFFLFTALTVFATFLYFTERLGKGESGAFRSIPHTMWFMAVTMTTVGYGDVTPLTDGGRIVTVMAMLFGVLFISMPLAIVGNNFCLVWDDKERVIFVEKLKEQLALRGMGPSDMLATVEAMDADGSGMLSFREFLAALNLLEIKMSANRLAVLWRTLDTDHSGDVSLINFMEVIHRDDPAQLEILRSQFPSLQEPSAADGDDDAEEEALSPRRRQSRPQTIAAEIRGARRGPAPALRGQRALLDARRREPQIRAAHVHVRHGDGLRPRGGIPRAPRRATPDPTQRRMSVRRPTRPLQPYVRRGSSAGATPPDESSRGGEDGAPRAKSQIVPFEDGDRPPNRLAPASPEKAPSDGAAPTTPVTPDAKKEAASAILSSGRSRRRAAAAAVDAREPFRELGAVQLPASHAEAPPSDADLEASLATLEDIARALRQIRAQQTALGKAQGDAMRELEGIERIEGGHPPDGLTELLADDRLFTKP
ncbi:voltage-gated potassium channel [Aureococcus anophagefferens]|nr:voltage-gated potassium channel [Aureococcus anophagefferens]